MEKRQSPFEACDYRADRPPGRAQPKAAATLINLGQEKRRVLTDRPFSFIDLTQDADGERLGKEVSARIHGKPVLWRMAEHGDVVPTSPVRPAISGHDDPDPIVVEQTEVFRAGSAQVGIVPMLVPAINKRKTVCHSTKEVRLAFRREMIETTATISGEICGKRNLSPAVSNAYYRPSLVLRDVSARQPFGCLPQSAG